MCTAKTGTARPSHAGSGPIAAAALMVLAFAGSAAAGVVEDAIESRVSRLAQRGSLTVGSDAIAAVHFLPEIYERRGFRPAWSTRERLESLLHAIDDAAHDGLVPDDYHRAELERQKFVPTGMRSAGESADLDLLATDALLRLVSHLYLGKVDPARLDSKWNFPRTLNREEAAGVVLRTLESGDIAALIARARPTQPIYQDLRRLHDAHRALAIQGGWPAIPSGRPLGSGAHDERVPILRRRLALSADVPRSRFGVATPDTSRRFDAALEKAVRSFQRRHLLEEDGAVGPATLAALNVPLERRIDQMRVNLERGRWVLHQIPDSFVVVNVAAYETYLVTGGRRKWSARSQVGQIGRQTPIFHSDMRYLVFNPTWTVPTGILSRDILPPLQRGDYSVLTRKKLKVLDAQGRVVAPKSVKWSKFTARSCPYTFRQDAGPDNALGRVKFMFPNSYSVYLHDTPSRDLFDTPRRAFSSGCIRVEHPLELAELLLADSKWDSTAIARTVASGKTTTVHLRRPLPVLLMYWTSYPVSGGQVVFAPDIYSRDARELKALDGPVRREGGGEPRP